MSDELEALAGNPIGPSVSHEEIAKQVVHLGARWSIAGLDLQLVLAGPKGMAACGAAVAYATTLADEMDHHPDIVMAYARTTLRIHTHDKQAITSLDLVYAARLERWLRAHGW
jgi:pterin-4a-carbinolamine dehydratase